MTRCDTKPDLAILGVGDTTMTRCDFFGAVQRTVGLSLQQLIETEAIALIGAGCSSSPWEDTVEPLSMVVALAIAAQALMASRGPPVEFVFGMFSGTDSCSAVG